MHTKLAKNRRISFPMLQKTPNLENMAFDRYGEEEGEGPVFDFVPSVAKMFFPFSVEKIVSEWAACVHSQWSPMPCTKLRLVRNINLQPCEWSA